jgi:hypothetical protein
LRLHGSDLDSAAARLATVRAEYQPLVSKQTLLPSVRDATKHVDRLDIEAPIATQEGENRVSSVSNL